MPRMFSLLMPVLLWTAALNAQGPLLHMGEHRSRDVEVEPVQPASVGNSSDSQSMYVGLIGFVRQPGVYELTGSQRRLGDLLKLAGGLDRQASGSLRIVRDGRSAIQMFVTPSRPESDHQLLPDDVVVVEGFQSRTLGAARTAAEARAQIENPNSALTHIAVVNLLDRPVVLPIWEGRATAGQLMQTLGQSPDILNSINVVSTPQGILKRRGQSGPVIEQSLQAGDVVVLLAGAANPNRIPVRLPEPHGARRTAPEPATIPRSIPQSSELAPIPNGGQGAPVPSVQTGSGFTSEDLDSGSSSVEQSRTVDSPTADRPSVENTSPPPVTDSSLTDPHTELPQDLADTTDERVEVILGPIESSSPSGNLESQPPVADPEDWWRNSQSADRSGQAGISSVEGTGASDEEALGGDDRLGEPAYDRTVRTNVPTVSTVPERPPAADATPTADDEDLATLAAAQTTARGWNWQQNLTFAVGYMTLIILGLGAVVVWKMVLTGEQYSRPRERAEETPETDPFELLLQNRLPVHDEPVRLPDRMEVQGRRPAVQPQRVDLAHVLQGPHRPLRRPAREDTRPQLPTAEGSTDQSLAAHVATGEVASAENLSATQIHPADDSLGAIGTHSRRNDSPSNGRPEVQPTVDRRDARSESMAAESAAVGAAATESSMVPKPAQEPSSKASDQGQKSQSDEPREATGAGTNSPGIRWRIDVPHPVPQANPVETLRRPRILSGLVEASTQNSRSESASRESASRMVGTSEENANATEPQPERQQADPAVSVTVKDGRDLLDRVLSRVKGESS